MPRRNRWRALQRWHKLYGPIISLRLGQRIAISLGTHKVARELLELRGNNYSSRPRFVVAGDYVSKGLHSILLPYGNQWRIHHRIQRELLTNRRTQAYRYLQDIESKQIVYDMLKSSDFVGHFRRYTSSVMFALAYGKRLESPGRHEIAEASKITENISLAADQAKNMIVEDLSNKEIVYILSALYEAGSETTATVLQIFVLASVLHPECIGRAQLELDELVGNDRMPTFEDMPRLPYVNAFIKEVLRWRPIAPLGIPHAPSKTDEFMEYRIPEGSTIFPNNWTLDLDDAVFRDPYAFKPERWLEDPNLPLSTFGFGRRACPGKQMAENSLYIAISRLIWGYNFNHAYENGLRVELDPWDMKEGVVSPPATLSAVLSVRSSVHQRIIEVEWDSTEKDVNGILGQIESIMESIMESRTAAQKDSSP
ncbi:hypothetical protein N7444_009582 [Penicillium canescens]|nr:hypothetical protein N7444_009582 [Penicillium canescens]